MILWPVILLTPTCIFLLRIYYNYCTPHRWLSVLLTAYDSESIWLGVTLKSYQYRKFHWGDQITIGFSVLVRHLYVESETRLHSSSWIGFKSARPGVLVDMRYAHRFVVFRSLKRKGRQGDSSGIHRRRWRQASTSPANTKAVTLTTFPFLCCVSLLSLGV